MQQSVPRFQSDNRRDGRLFTPEDLRFLEAFADHAALALENSRTRTELQRDNLRLQAEAESAVHYGNLVGRSPGMLQSLFILSAIRRNIQETASDVKTRLPARSRRSNCRPFQ